MRRPIFVLLAGGGLLVMAYLLLNRLNFVRTAKKTIGQVTHVAARDASCGRRRSRHSCTKFKATVRYNVAGSDYYLYVDAGAARGYGQGIERASRQIGSSVRVTYSPRRPSLCYEDTFMGVWGSPFMALMVSLGLGLAGVTERRRRSLL